MMDLTKNDKYEIEKILDIYAGWLSDSMNKKAHLSMTACGADKDALMTVLDDQFLELERSFRSVMMLRDKFEKERNKK